ncbi:MAG: bifunctional UDP-N-acetylmuramoyl-tripeptide:D-alanyl-D-alanine ligase/alanine racemase [Muribaculaceae bacterium]|nr:bifunctional UDP-N-acetylmuramoyl-tripeptide:D-alanyl-D-alanine ligase/alanine racemase [Muribaculaceae bacterium]
MQISEIASLLSLPIPSRPSEITTLLTDSRSLETPSGTLFFAIPTAGNDGHRYIASLYREGVRDFVVNRIPEELKNAEDINWLIVDDTVAALQRVAGRKPEFEGKILALTGSRGKTTLKEWIFQLMEPLADIARSPRSYNSRIGVPLSMWEIKQSTSLAIIEAGISSKGEMKPLAECIQPDWVIITNIGDQHSEGFGSLAEKAREKMLLAAQENVKAVIFCADYPLLKEAAKELPEDKKILSWSLKGDPEASIQISATERAGGLSEVRYVFDGVESVFFAPLTFSKDLENGANALAFMLLSGIDRDTIAERFRNLHKIGTRLNVSEGVNGCSVVLDQYTSDFSSLRPALDFIRRRQTPSQSVTLILSDLHHEDMDATELYGRISRLVRKAGVGRFIGVGRVLRSYSSLFPEGSLFFDDARQLTSALSPSDFADEIILIKGSPEIPLSGVAEMLETRTHETVLEVNLDAIIDNYNYFRGSLPSGVGMVCMVKASGYGAGSYEIAKTLQDCGAAYLAVAVLDEGIELRRKGIVMPIMVMNPKVVNYRSMFSNRLEPEIYSFEMLEDVISEARKNGIRNYPIHIKLDTGMHRTGFVEEELPRLMDILCGTEEVTAHSVFSHLATADCPDMNDYTEMQLSLFTRYTGYMLGRYPKKILRHILNSAGILRFPQYHFDMVRLGIGLYGANTLPPEMEKPLAVVSTLRTVIIAIREYGPGTTIGYGRHGKIIRPSRIATIPIGYADGMNRHFGRGNASVFVNGEWAPTIGNICMDACMIDVTDIDCRVGDTVEIFGRNAPLQRLADTLETIPYEILTSVSPRVKRVYYRE